MKHIVIIIVIGISSILSSASAQNTQVVTKTLTSPAWLKTPVVEANEVKGGVHQVANEVDRDNIPTEFKKEGMFCYVTTTKSMYQWRNGSWQILRFIKQSATQPISPELGEIIFNTTTKTYQYYDGTNWQELTTPADGGVFKQSSKYIYAGAEKESILYFGVNPAAYPTLPAKSDTVLIFDKKQLNFLVGDEHAQNNSYSSSLVGGQTNIIKDSHHNGIFSGRDNELTSSSYGAVVSGRYNKIQHSGWASILSGQSNSIISSSYSSIVGGTSLTIENGTDRAGIFAGQSNKINSAHYSVILGGLTNNLNSSVNSAILSGTNNDLNGSDYSIAAGGIDLNITGSRNSGLYSGRSNNLTSSGYSTILAGQTNKITSSGKASIIAGYGNTINGSSNSSIVGGHSLKVITGSDFSGLFTGKLNSITNSFYSVALGGFTNSILTSINSAILAGANSSLSTSHYSVVAGGDALNISTSEYAGLYSGKTNSLSSSNYSVVLAGESNHITSSGNAAIIAGRGHRITSSSYASIIAGNNNIIALGTDYSVLGGLGLKTKTSSTVGKVNQQIIFGKYNYVNENALFSLGFGTGDADRISLFELTQTGNLTIAGGLTIGNTLSSTAGDADYYTLPATRGASNQILISDGAGNVTWQNQKADSPFTLNHTLIYGGNFADAEFVFGANAKPTATDQALYFSKKDLNFTVGGNHTLTSSTNSSILGGRLNRILTAHNSTILGGISNIISANSQFSVIGGRGLVTSASLAADNMQQIIFGQYNYHQDNKDALFQIGAGTGTTKYERKTILQLQKDGSLSIAGGLTIGNTVSATKDSDAYSLPASKGTESQILVANKDGNLVWSDQRADPRTVKTYSDDNYVYTCVGTNAAWYAERMHKVTYVFEKYTQVGAESMPTSLANVQKLAY